MNNWDKILVHARDKVRAATRNPSACATMCCGAPRSCALSFIAARSRSLAGRVRLHRPQSDQVPSPFAPSHWLGRAPGTRNGDRRRGGHCPCRITSIGITEECQQPSRPATTQRTDPTISLDRKSGPTSPQSRAENKALSSNHQCTSTFQVLLGYLCRPQCTLVSRGHQSWLAVLVLLDADSLLDGEALDLTDPNVVDHVLQLAWSGSIGFAAGALTTQRPARRSFGKHGMVAAV